MLHRRPAGLSSLGLGIHEVDLIRFLIGQPITSVSACSNRLGDLEFPKSKTTATVFQFAGGAIGQTAICYEAHWPKGAQPGHHFLLVASRGVVYGSQYKSDDSDSWEDLPKDDDETAAGCRGCVDAFLAALTGGTTVPVTPRDTYATLAACIAADESAATGKTLTPDSENFA